MHDVAIQTVAQPLLATNPLLEPGDLHVGYDEPRPFPTLGAPHDLASLAATVPLRCLTPASPYGLHTWVGAEFVAIMTGQITPTMDGFTAQEVVDFRNATIVSVDPSTGEQARAHFDLATTTAGLQMVDASLS